MGTINWSVAEFRRRRKHALMPAPSHSIVTDRECTAGISTLVFPTSYILTRRITLIACQEEGGVGWQHKVTVLMAYL